ncbi:hypothetical protein TVAG_358340 [Trichomonas vaginalis G3]|uniref:receptor protein-tyrosine kinase n=1 Tax=Trichomonas vaginalis (strain ATCC PRA-98 / G3) TaxID=412133 RepID=A2ELE2_TRIV3|nr:glycine-rich protein family [Trichomonas vaginalis G3]EAY06544.1 hypothetical protein TVAG_358340 [Trichomonas vaginalis G3]KAI5526113.1 glycine-rich protein family [Trichomonas vaginalis G3]|eukprot:XP_001318767.1 hypothetical protein [Trichomonas vaginalis G3]
MGGFNGGGNGSFYSLTYTYGGGGGGASDIRLETDSFNTRIIVAGGGGGSGHGESSTSGTGYNYHNPGGAGGGYEGCNGIYNPSYFGINISGGTQFYPGPKSGLSSTAGFGYGGSNKATDYVYSGAGGGGGWFGGSGSYGKGFGAAGGSGYVLTMDSYKPIEYIYKIEYFLRKASMKTGVHYGNGAIRITILDYIGKYNNIKFRGCGTPGFSYSQIVSLITLPTVV